MRTPLLVAALAALTLASCSSNDPEDVVLPSRETLVQRYGSVAPGTFRARHPSARLEYTGMDLRLDSMPPAFLSAIDRDKSMIVRIYSGALESGSNDDFFTWSGSYNGPEGPHECSGPLYVMESTSSLLRAVFAGACGKVDPLSGPRDFTLLEGGFAYVR